MLGVDAVARCVKDVGVTVLADLLHRHREARGAFRRRSAGGGSRSPPCPGDSRCSAASCTAGPRSHALAVHRVDDVLRVDVQSRSVSPEGSVNWRWSAGCGTSGTGRPRSAAAGVTGLARLCSGAQVGDDLGVHCRPALRPQRSGDSADKSPRDRGADCHRRSIVAAVAVDAVGQAVVSSGLQMAWIVHLGGDVALLAVLGHFRRNSTKSCAAIGFVGILIALAVAVTVSAVDRRLGMYAVHRRVQHRQVYTQIQRLARRQRIHLFIVYVTEFACGVGRRLREILGARGLAPEQRAENGEYSRQGKQPRAHPASRCVQGRDLCLNHVVRRQKTPHLRSGLWRSSIDPLDNPI
jgi:hypothetical protein